MNNDEFELELKPSTLSQHNVKYTLNPPQPAQIYQKSLNLRQHTRSLKTPFSNTKNHQFLVKDFKEKEQNQAHKN